MTTAKTHRSLPSFTSVRLLTLVLCLVGLTACSGAQEYRGEASDCSASVPDSETILLLDRDETGKVTGGWFVFEIQTGVLVGTEIENIDADAETLRFDAEFENGSTRLDVEVDLEKDGTEYVGDIEFEAQDAVRCDIELELEDVR